MAPESLTQRVGQLEAANVILAASCNRLESYFRSVVVVAGILGLASIPLILHFGNAWSSVSELKLDAQTTKLAFDDLKKQIGDTASFMNAFPPGTIVAWSSKYSGEIPRGWHECNGREHTPDLRGLFIVGAQNAAEDETPVGSNSISLPVSGTISAAWAVGSFPDRHDGGGAKGTPELTGLAHNHLLQNASATGTILPKSVELTYIMKLKLPDNK